MNIWIFDDEPCLVWCKVGFDYCFFFFFCYLYVQSQNQSLLFTALFRFPSIFQSLQNIQIYDNFVDFPVSLFLCIISPLASNCFITLSCPDFRCVFFVCFLTFLHLGFRKFLPLLCLVCLLSCLNINEVVTFVQKFMLLSLCCCFVVVAVVKWSCLNNFLISCLCFAFCSFCWVWVFGRFPEKLV